MNGSTTSKSDALVKSLDKKAAPNPGGQRGKPPTPKGDCFHQSSIHPHKTQSEVMRYLKK